MPITITPGPDLTTIGPGLPIVLQSDFIGPFPSDAQWHLDINLEPDFVKPFLAYTKPCTGPITSLTLLVQSDWIETRNAYTPQNTRGLVLEARITTNTGTIDSGTRLNTPWDTSTGLGFQIHAQTGTSVTGGFTESDRQLLTQAELQTQVLGQPQDLVLETASGPIQTTVGKLLSRNLLDMLTLDELTQGPTADPVRVSFSGWYYGVIVRVTTIAEDLVAKTPDLEWYFPDLAVLRIFRGGDLLFRRGIHTPTFMTEHPWEWGSQFLNVADVLGVPPDLTIAVDWRLGCAGQVFLQRYP